MQETCDQAYLSERNGKGLFLGITASYFSLLNHFVLI